VRSEFQQRAPTPSPTSAPPPAADSPPCSPSRKKLRLRRRHACSRGRTPSSRSTSSRPRRQCCGTSMRWWLPHSWCSTSSTAVRRAGRPCRGCRADEGGGWLAAELRHRRACARWSSGRDSHAQPKIPRPWGRSRKSPLPGGMAPQRVPMSTHPHRGRSRPSRI
jgi:hypothetical protein